jgi:predicted nucleic acid-binding protein
MSLVLDGSVALAWLYQDEGSPVADQIIERVSLEGGWVPMIWHLEVGNSLQMSVRRHRISPQERDQAIIDLSSLNILIDTDTITYAWTTTLDLADRFRLTLYDACYLELALRRALPLASLDNDLRAAATEMNVELLGR